MVPVNNPDPEHFMIPRAHNGESNGSGSSLGKSFKFFHSRTRELHSRFQKEFAKSVSALPSSPGAERGSPAERRLAVFLFRPERPLRARPRVHSALSLRCRLFPKSSIHQRRPSEERCRYFRQADSKGCLKGSGAENLSSQVTGENFGRIPGLEKISRPSVSHFSRPLNGHPSGCRHRNPSRFDGECPSRSKMRGKPAVEEQKMIGPPSFPRTRKHSSLRYPFQESDHGMYPFGRGPDERHAIPPAEVQGEKRGRSHPSARKARQYRRILPHLSAGSSSFQGVFPGRCFRFLPAETEHTVNQEASRSREKSTAVSSAFARKGKAPQSPENRSGFP